MATAPVKINRTYDVPYLAGSSKRTGETYIDRRIPKTLTVKGKTFDPSKYLAIHEQTEHGHMMDGDAYEVAHRKALKAERSMVERDGIKWSDYQEQMTRLAAKTQREKIRTAPPDLYTKPYPHTEARLLQKDAAHKAAGGGVQGMPDLPEGFTLDAPASATSAAPVGSAGLPQGFTLDEQPATAAPAPPAQPLSWRDVPGQALQNAVPSTLSTVGNMVQPFLHPVQTAENINTLGEGLTGKVLRAVGAPTPTNPEYAPGAAPDQAVNAVGQFFANRYGGVDKLKQTLATDPVGVAADLSAVLSGGETLGARVPGIVGDVSRAAGTVGRTIDPITNAGRAMTLAARGVGNAASLPLGVITGEGPKVIATAGRAGLQGNQVFRNQLLGTADVNQPVDMAQSALKQIAQDRAAAYKSGMTGVKSDTTPLSFAPINKAVADARDMAWYKGVAKSQDAADTHQAIENVVQAWQQQPPSRLPNGKQYYPHQTAEGMDALKQAIGEIRSGTEYGTVSRNIADSVYNKVKDQIVAQAPDYAGTMGAYSDASKQLNELRKTFSLGEKATNDQALRKLQSVMRDNVNANWGARSKLGDVLATKEPDLPYAIAGQAMHPILPRGIARYLAGGEGIAALTHPGAILPLAAGMLASSPRAVGLGAYYGGRGINALQHVATPGIGQAAYQFGRLPLPDDLQPTQ